MNDKIKVQDIKVDYIIVGQGLAGTWLSFELLKRGHSVVVINHHSIATSSRKAAGLYNPITGRKMVKTWRADELFDGLEQDYKELEKLLGKSFLHPLPIYRPFASVSDQNDWEGRRAEAHYEHFLREVRFNSLGLDDIKDEYGGIILQKCGYVNLPVMLDAYMKYLQNKGIYHEEVFDYEKMKLGVEEVQYKQWRGNNIIFCEGPQTTNSYWNDLPFRLVRGETIDVVCELKSNYVINQGVFMIPKGDFFTVGSTYDHKVLSYEPQESGVENLVTRLGKLFTGSIRIVDKRAGIRPATHDRKPYIGFHKKFKSIGIFNGFGTKGVSLSPYFAKHYVDVLENKCELDKEVDVQRVY